eukprot:7232502-Karenia_brevis.AAC.1
MAINYSRFCPLFGDGTYFRCYIKARVDRAHKVRYGHNTQKIQMSNALAETLTPEHAENVGWDSESAGAMPGGPSIYY